MSAFEIPDVIYHYCTVDKLEKILHSKCMWLNPAWHMNDSTECQWYKFIVMNVVTKLSMDNTLDQNRLNKICESIFLNGDFASKFISSFSADGDSLSQWRGYAGDGTGFAIGFETSKMQLDTALCLVNANDQYSIKLNRVIYDRNEQFDIMEAEIRRFLLSTSDPIESAILSGFASIFKHPGFKDEQECRIIYTPPLFTATLDHLSLELCHRDNGKNMIPFFKWPFPTPYPITKIVFGPKNVTTQEAIVRLLQDNGFSTESIQIARSETPYR